MSLPVKTINILGVTGSIGQSTADVILSDPHRFDVQVVTACTNAEKLADLAIKLNARAAVLADSQKLDLLKSKLEGTGIQASGGPQALEEAASQKVDLTVAGIVGMAGLRPVLKAIHNSKAVAIANKEPLVAAGPLVMAEAHKHGTQLLPVDSEHNAIFQVFDFKNRNKIEKIILTASGGPFRTWSKEDMARATPAQALAHPNWEMGKKISIDSATMMNKALEIIEAHYLFQMPPEKIEVMIHPQSVVHSMVEYSDGSILAQMGASDMRTPIACALAWPERMATPGQRLDLAKMSQLTFEAPDFERFPALRLAYDCLRAGPYACVALNAANEVAVDEFLNHRAGFLDIINCVDHILGLISGCALDTLEAIESYDRDVRNAAKTYMNKQTSQQRVSSL